MFFQRYKDGQDAILVHPKLSAKDSEDSKEFIDLVRSAGIKSLIFITVNVKSPSPRYFIGSGKVEEIRRSVLQYRAELIFVNHALSPSQVRNLEKDLQCCVIDRTGLILSIFAQRARTFEGKLQVELAQLEYMSTRLIRGWTHLERQKGGIGLSGPGETQLETDRRLLQIRIKHIVRRLEKMQRQRDQGRRFRKKSKIFQVSLIGYTNSGKSTLFNNMTQSNVYTEDQLFATLDPTLRKLDLKKIRSIVLADTVGFIRNIHCKLVKAFRATLEEIRQADLLLHVIDAHDSELLEKINTVHNVLEEIGASTVPILQIYNKIDLSKDIEPKIQYRNDGTPKNVWISAKNKIGFDLIEQALTTFFSNEIIQGQLQLTAAQGKVRARLYQMAVIQSEEYSDDGELLLNIRISKTDYDRVLKEEGLPKNCLSKKKF